MKKMLLQFSLLLYGATLAANIQILDIQTADAGRCDGEIMVEAEGTAGPFSLWISGPGNYRESIENVNGLFTFVNLCGGMYQIAVVNAYECVVNLTAEVPCDLLQPLADFFSFCPPSGQAAADGALCLEMDTTQGWNVEWTDDPDASLCRTGLSAGFYCARISHAGCSVVRERCFELKPELASLSLEIAGLQPSCSDPSLAEICVRGLGGQPPYAYSWSSGETGECITVGGNSVGVTVTDACGRSYSETVDLTEKDLRIDRALISSHCGSTPNGSIFVEIAGGAPPYDYYWTQNGWPIWSLLWKSPAQITGLSAGVYYLTVTDSCGRTVTEQFYVNFNFTNFTIYKPKIVPACNGEPAGAVYLSLLPKNGAYQFQWRDEDANLLATTQNVNGLAGGNYSVSVAQGTCVRTAGFAIADVPIEIEPIIMHDCHGQGEGAIELTVGEADKAYAYEWNDGAKVKNRVNLSAGYYTVTVSNGPSCAAVFDFEIKSNCFGQNAVVPRGELPQTALTPRVSDLNIVKVYPNPFSAFLQVDLFTNRKQSVRLRLFTMLGREVFAREEDLPEGSHSVSLDLKFLPSGMYKLTIEDDEGQQRSEKVIHQQP